MIEGTGNLYPYNHLTLKGKNLDFIKQKLADYNGLAIWRRTCNKLAKEVEAAEELYPPMRDESMWDWTLTLVFAGVIAGHEMDTWLAGMEIACN